MDLQATSQVCSSLSPAAVLARVVIPLEDGGPTILLTNTTSGTCPRHPNLNRSIVILFRGRFIAGDVSAVPTGSHEAVLVFTGKRLSMALGAGKLEQIRPRDDDPPPNSNFGHDAFDPFQLRFPNTGIGQFEARSDPGLTLRFCQDLLPPNTEPRPAVRRHPAQPVPLPALGVPVHVEHLQPSHPGNPAQAAVETEFGSLHGEPTLVQVG